MDIRAGGSVSKAPAARVERSERAAFKPWQSLRNRRDDRANDVAGLQIEKNGNLRLVANDLKWTRRELPLKKKRN